MQFCPNALSGCSLGDISNQIKKWQLITVQSNIGKCGIFHQMFSFISGNEKKV
jgi:hypothetical protein